MKNSMKHFTYIAIVLIAVMSFAITASATDHVISGKITSVTQKATKNGDAYTILVVPESRELNGVKYTTETSVFCFKTPDAKMLKSGDSVKLIAKRSVSRDGNEFVTLISFLK